MEWDMCKRKVKKKKMWFCTDGSIEVKMDRVEKKICGSKVYIFFKI
jgi:hypothetical protein